MKNFDITRTIENGLMHLFIWLRKHGLWHKHAKWCIANIDGKDCACGLENKG